MHQKAGLDWALERTKHVDHRTWHRCYEDQLDKVFFQNDNDDNDDDNDDDDKKIVKSLNSLLTIWYNIMNDQSYVSSYVVKWFDLRNSTSELVEEI